MTQRKFFIDCGAHRGESIRLFRSQYPNASDYKIISFEPNPDNAEFLFIKEFADVDIHRSAVWIENGEMDFYSHAYTVGYSLFDTHPKSTKQTIGVKVPTIDFSAWLRDNFLPEDYVIAKIDIEGAEFKVLQKMFADGTIDLIDKLYIEFHDHWMTLEPGECDKLKADLITKGLKPLDWCAGPGRTHIPEKDLI